MNQINLLLENQDVQAVDGVTFDRLDPITGEVATRASAAQIADAKRAADAAAAAFPGWAATGPSLRRKILLKAADELGAQAAQFVELMATETGATAGWAGFNVGLAAGMLREAAAMTTQLSGEVHPVGQPGCIAMAVRQPAGSALHPGTRPSSWACARGAAARLRQHRGSEGVRNMPGTHRLIAGCLRAAGLPPGVVNVITNAPEDAPALIEALISHPAVRRVELHRLDPRRPYHRPDRRKISQAGAARAGGKAPLIVLDDADSMRRSRRLPSAHS